MASPAASLAISQALAVTANPAAMADVTVVVKDLRRVALVWAMRLSVRNAMLWNQPKMPCVAWLHKPTAKC
jgi:sRNA-binding protein